MRAQDANPEARLALVNILKQKALGVGETHYEAGRSKHLKRLVSLQDWAPPMKLRDGRATYHVLEAIHPAEAILFYARAHHVHHIIMGARKKAWNVIYWTACRRK
jgi:K+-sensing histidine kinase KdpD